jgi:CHASE3 domain sensor protein
LQKIRNCYELLPVTLFIFLALGYSFYSENHVFAQTDQTGSKLQTANSAVAQAFNAILDAEKAGGNVTQLLVKLNIAGEYLAKAQNAYNSGNTTNVATLVENARQITDQVNGDAVKLAEVNLVDSQNDFWLTFTFSFVGAVLFVVSLLFVWRRFRRSFMKKLLGMKPEVAEN